MSCDCEYDPALELLAGMAQAWGYRLVPMEQKPETEADEELKQFGVLMSRLDDADLISATKAVELHARQLQSLSSDANNRYRERKSALRFDLVGANYTDHRPVPLPSEFANRLRIATARLEVARQILSERVAAQCLAEAQKAAEAADA